MGRLGFDKVVTSETKNFLINSFREGLGLGDENATLDWQPFPGPQEWALESEADELYAGGSAGGGKTGLICGLATKYHHHTIIFRTTYDQLDELVEQITGILGKFGKYNASKNFFRNLANGGRINLRAVGDDDDLKKFKGRPNDLIAFDEITEFPFSHYEFLTIWNRSTRPGQRVRIVCTGNPPLDEKGRWVINYWGPWLDKKYTERTGRPMAKPGELRWFVVKDGEPNPNSPETHFDEVDGPEPVLRNGEWETPRSRTFIPMFLRDNPKLRDTGYRAKLQALRPAMRAAYLDGRFDLDFEAPDHPFQVIPGAWIRAAQARWVAFVETYGLEHIRATERLTALGIDPSRGGGDATAIAPRYTNFFDEIQKEYGETVDDGQKVAQLVLDRFMKKGQKAPIFIDVIGWGSAPHDILKMAGIEQVYAVNGAEASYAVESTGLLGFYNKRAEIYWLFAEALNPLYDSQIMLPPSETLYEDLRAPRYEIVKGGKGVRGQIKIEKKEETIKRLGRSPDEGESVTYSYILPPTPQIRNLADALGDL